MLREYVMQPWTCHVWPMCEQRGHFENIPSTFFSGATIGVLAAFWLRRPVVPGAITMSGLCATVQLGFNELKLGAQRWIEPSHRPDHSESIEVREQTKAPTVRPDDPIHQAQPLHQPSTSSWLSRTKEVLQKHSPIQPITDEDYRKRLEERLREIDAGLHLLEEELSERRKVFPTS